MWSRMILRGFWAIQNLRFTLAQKWPQTTAHRPLFGPHRNNLICQDMAGRFYSDFLIYVAWKSIGRFCVMEKYQLWIVTLQNSKKSAFPWLTHLVDMSMTPTDNYSWLWMQHIIHKSSTFPVSLSGTIILERSTFPRGNVRSNTLIILKSWKALEL